MVKGAGPSRPIVIISIARVIWDFEIIYDDGKPCAVFRDHCNLIPQRQVFFPMGVEISEYLFTVHPGRQRAHFCCAVTKAQVKVLTMLQSLLGKGMIPF